MLAKIFPTTLWQYGIEKKFFIFLQMPFMNGQTFKTGDGCWNTPKHIKDEIYKEYDINFDPCPVDPDYDGLTIDWKERNFCNPPFHETERWIRKLLLEREKGRRTVLLISCQTSTHYFHELILPNVNEIRFFAGRIRFQNQSGKKSAASPWPNILCIFRPLKAPLGCSDSL